MSKLKTTYCKVFQLLMETGIDLLTKIFHHADEPHQNWKNTILGVLHQVHNHKDKYESKALKRGSELIEKLQKAVQ